MQAGYSRYKEKCSEGMELPNSEMYFQEPTHILSLQNLAMPCCSWLHNPAAHILIAQLMSMSAAEEGVITAAKCGNTAGALEGSPSGNWTLLAPHDLVYHSIAGGCSHCPCRLVHT